MYGPGWMGGWMDGWLDGWMGGWVVGWMGGRAGLRIAYRNQKAPLKTKMKQDNIIKQGAKRGSVFKFNFNQIILSFSFKLSQ